MAGSYANELSSLQKAVSDARKTSFGVEAYGQYVAIGRRRIKWSEFDPITLDGIRTQLEEILYNQHRAEQDRQEVLSAINDIKSMVGALAAERGSETGEELVADNYNMSVEDIKKIIAKECEPGQQYYPSDIAFKHGLNYDTVLEAVSSLKEEGRIDP